MSNRIRVSHLFMFVALALPVWTFSLLLKLQIVILIESSPWVLFLVQTIPLVSWWLYTSLVPSVIGEIRLGLATQKEALSQTVATGVTTRATFLAIAIAGMALIGLEVMKPASAPSLYSLGMTLFILSFLAFVISTDISDSAKNVPFRTSQRGVILTKRGARYYQYGLTYMIIAFAVSMAKVGEVFCVGFVVLWDIGYLLANLPTGGSSYSRLTRLGGLLTSLAIMLLPIYNLLWDQLPLDGWQGLVAYALLTLLTVVCTGVIFAYYKPVEQQAPRSRKKAKSLLPERPEMKGNTNGVKDQSDPHEV